MTTPINSLQIVMGKLLSRLLQLTLLLAISLPILAMVRVFGGVPWEYVIAGLSITVTGMIFTGSVSLMISISNRRAYMAILKAGFLLIALFLLLPVSLLMSLANDLPPWGTGVLIYMNPAWSLALTTGAMVAPGPVGRAMSFFWQTHCLVVLGMSAAVLTVCVVRVRRAGLRQIAGDDGGLLGRKRKKAPVVRQGNLPEGVSVATAEREGTIRRLRGAPVLWRELRRPMFRSKKQAIIGISATLAMLLGTYVACGRYLDSQLAQVIFALVFIIIGLIGTCVLSATSISTERESGSLPILLGTTLGDWEIILGKALGVVRRCLGVWALLAGHLLLFVAVGYIHPIALVHLGLLAGWLVVFLTGTGLYFSSRFRRTTTAVVANIGLALLLWVVAPAGMGLLAMLSGEDEGVSAAINANPVYQAGLLAGTAGGSRNAHRSLDRFTYEWAGGSYLTEDGNCDAMATTGRMVGYLVLYGLAGVVFATGAWYRLRRSLF